MSSEVEKMAKAYGNEPTGVWHELVPETKKLEALAYKEGYKQAVKDAEATTDGSASSSKEWNDGYLAGKRALIAELKERCGE